MNPNHYETTETSRSSMISTYVYLNIIAENKTSAKQG